MVFIFTKDWFVFIYKYLQTSIQGRLKGLKEPENLLNMVRGYKSIREMITHTSRDHIWDVLHHLQKIVQMDLVFFISAAY